MTNCRLIEIDNIDYDEAWDLMKGLVAARIDGRINETIILAEHPPVITLGRRGQESDVVAPQGVLSDMGVLVRRIERGGLATYHGPGQQVIYPVVELKSIGRSVVECVRALEETIIRTLADFDVEGQRHDGHPGVFTAWGKIASIGLAVKRGITYHGLSFNYAPDMNHFGLINPCGLSASEMTSLARILGREVDGAEVRGIVKKHLAEVFGLEFTPWPLDEAKKEAALSGNDNQA